jgi:hypothetical protein
LDGEMKYLKNADWRLKKPLFRTAREILLRRQLCNFNCTDVPCEGDE